MKKKLKGKNNLEHGSNGKASVRPQVQFSVTEKKD
jgi:hypothetical protein